MWDSANSESAHAWPLHPIALLMGSLHDLFKTAR
jgi:hypothetical protein